MKNLFRHHNQQPSIDRVNEHESFEQFLANDYLKNEYLVPEHIDRALRQAAEELRTYEGFEAIINVGGTANGSYEWRARESGRAPASDLDYYLIGDQRLDIQAASAVVAAHMKEIHLSVDGILNGQNLNNFLDIEHLDACIDRGDSALLALAFQSYYGDRKSEVQERVLKTVQARADKEEVWDVVAKFHIESLSLHHGTFSEVQNRLIMDDYYPQKVGKFELPLTPEEALEHLKNK